MPARVTNNVLTYEGCNYLRYRLLLSTLSGKPVRIVDIRRSNDDPGLREYEINFIRLLDKITNGTRIELDETGTSLYYNPGLLIGGETEHECSPGRGIGYYLEPLMAVAPFCKKPLDVRLVGITNNSPDPSVDRIKATGVPILKRFLAGDDRIELILLKRGAAPLGGGEVRFRCPIGRNLRTIQLEDVGMVKRIRGVACGIRVSPAIANRMVESAKGVLLNYIPDVYIHTDRCRGAASGKSPGFGVSLTAETTTGVFFGGEAFSPLTSGGSLPCVPEDLGKEAALKLLDEIHRSGCVDSPFQSMTALFMALGRKDVSRIEVGPLTRSAIQFLRDLKDFLGVTFKIEPATEGEEDGDVVVRDQVLLTCVGIGYTNLSRRVL